MGGKRRRIARWVITGFGIWLVALVIVALVVLSAALLYRVAHTASWSAFDMGLAYLTMLQILPLAGFVRKGWFGVSSVRREVPAVQTSLSAEPGD